MKRFLVLALLLAGFAQPAYAVDAVGAQTVSACGTPNNTPVVGNPYAITMDTSGRLCTGAVSGTVSVAATGINIADTPTIQNAAYASGNCMGGFQTVAMGSAASILSSVSLASQGGLATAKQIYIFDANPSGSTCTDKSTFTIATADLSKLMATFPLTPAAPTGTTKTFAANGSMALGLPSGGTIYVAVVETASETPATISDLVLNFSGF